MNSYSPSSVIIFIDIDAFEVQLYQRDYPQFRNQPCVVANSSGLILAASYEAKAKGISRTKTPKITQAREILPNIKVFWKKDKYGKQDSTKTRHATFELLTCVKNCFPNPNDVKIEMAASDEIYIDVSALVTKGMEARSKLEDCRERPPFISIPSRVVWETTKGTRFGPFPYYTPKSGDFKYRGKRRHLYYKDLATCRLIFGALLLDSLLFEIQSKIHLEASGGVGCNRFLAKIACGLHKPQRITVFHHLVLQYQFKYREPSKCLATKISISDIPGLKGKTGQDLYEKFGVSTMLDLQRITLEALINELGTDKGNKIFNWGKGLDNTPVQNKQLKESYTCKKPAECKITSFRTLQKCIKNLSLEISDLIYEERIFYKRTVKNVRVVFTDDQNKADSKEFDISTKQNLEALPTTIWKFFKAELKSFNLKSLSFVLRNFIDISGADEADSDSLPQALQEVMQENLPSDTLKVMPKSINAQAVSLNVITHVGAFRTTVQGKCSLQPDDLILPILKSSEELKEIMDFKFETGDAKTNPHILITDYAMYHGIKHSCFLQWLEKNYEQVMLDESGHSQVDFVSFNGRIADPLLTPLLPPGCKWENYAINIGNTIYLWNEKLTNVGPTSEAGLFGLLFERLVARDCDSPIVETDKVFHVDKLQLGNHKLLIVNQIDGQTSDNRRAQVCLQSDKYYAGKDLKRKRNLQLYGQSLISGCDHVILGTRKDNILSSIETFDTLDKFTVRMDIGNVQECLQFQNRLLSWIKAHLPKSSCNVVKRFSWISGENSVKSYQVPNCEIHRLVVPRIYEKYFRKVHAD